MPAVSIDLNMVRVTNDEFVKKAEACTPKLIETVVRPVAIVDIVKSGRLCDSETEFRRKSAGFTGVFQTEIR